MDTISLIFPKLSRFQRVREPVTAATPHPEGTLMSADCVRICCDGVAFPSQSIATALWPDGSIKWLFTRFLADLPGNAGCVCTLCEGEPDVPEQLVMVTRGSEGGIRIENGSLTAELGAPGTAAIQGVSFPEGAFRSGEMSGPFIQAEGTRYDAIVGESGWSIIENGPVYAAVRACGRHAAESGAKLLDYELTVSTYAGRPEIELEYRIIHREENPFLDIEAMRLDICPDTAAQSFSLSKSHYGTTTLQSSDKPLRFFIDEDYLRCEDIEHVPEVFTGTFFGDWRDDMRGVCLYIRQAFQNYPKALDADTCGIRAGLVPERASIRFYQGSAKRHRLLIRFHGANEDIRLLDIRGLQYEMPDEPRLLPETYIRAGLFAGYIFQSSHRFAEAQIKRMAYDTKSTLGMMSFGDWWDGREWQNEEYDPAHWYLVQYARTGERAMLDKMVSTGEHQLDVDICHFSHDPRRAGAHIQHSPEHATGDTEVCHQWVEGLFDYYHHTGDKRALSAAKGVAQNILYILETHIYPRQYYGYPRELGWALRALATVYVETHDPQWLKPCDQIVVRFMKWQAEYGAWLSPYTTHTLVRVPFMQSVAIRALALYERIKPDEQLRAMILREIDDILQNGSTYTGVFYYKELPGTQYDSPLGHIFESVAIGYRYTGDASYLLRAQSAFNYFMRCRIDNIHSPRNFAEAYPGVIAYMKALEDSEML